MSYLYGRFQQVPCTCGCVGVVIYTFVIIIPAELLRSASLLTLESVTLPESVVSA